MTGASAEGGRRHASIVASAVTATAVLPIDQPIGQPVAVVAAAPVVITPGVAAPAPAPVVAPAAPAPKPEAPAAAIGPFFEMRDVNKAPRVATRVEPQIPAELRAGQLNEVVIVRVLVTQTGQPLIVSLLRRSKAGVALDNAVVAAVKQWTFTPATKRGAAVSCWYHGSIQVRAGR